MARTTKTESVISLKKRIKELETGMEQIRDYYNGNTTADFRSRQSIITALMVDVERDTVLK